MPITLKQYYCPTCGNQEKHSTNHYGEIYSPCRNCGGGVLYCAEDIAYQERDNQSKVWARIHFYRFNIGEKAQLQAYNALCKELKSQGRVKFDCIANNQHKYLEELSRGAVLFEVYNPDTFDNQYITAKGRLFSWYEAIYPNKKIKQGYYLYLQSQEGFED
jgi:hypothetical protein